MSTYNESSINDGYEELCRESLPKHLLTSTKIRTMEHEIYGYNRIIKNSDYPTVFSSDKIFRDSHDKIINHFEIDFCGHSVDDFDEKIDPMINIVCDESKIPKVFASNFISSSVSFVRSDKIVNNISPTKFSAICDLPTSTIKYVLAEITNSGSKSSAEKKLLQLERGAIFFMKKSEAVNIEDCICLLIVVTPEESSYHHIRSLLKSGSYPNCKLLCDKGRLLFIRNTNTIMNRIGHIENDLSNFTFTIEAKIGDTEAKVEDTQEKVEDIKNLLKYFIVLVILLVLLLVFVIVYLLSINFRMHSHNNEF